MTTKNVKFSERPRPPTLDQMIADVQSAKENDVVFQYAEVLTENDTSNDISDNDVSDRPSLLNQDSTDTSGKNTSGANESFNNDLSPAYTAIDSKVQKHYEDVRKFLLLNEQLKKAPAELQSQYEHLRKLGKELNDSINELKQSADQALGTNKAKV